VTQMMPGEHPIRVTRQHWTVFLQAGLACLAALFIVIVLLVITPGTVSGHDIHSIKVIVGLAAGLLIVAIMLVRWVRWRCTSYTLTNHRIVSRHGILSRYTESIALDRVQDSSVRQRLLGRMFRFGDLELESAGRDGTETFHHIANPSAFSQDLLVAIEARRTGMTGMPQQLPAAGSGGGAVPEGYVPPGAQGGEPGGFGPTPGYSRGPDGL
jgi:uncharacterized membrane protein YdbT with pleckstrin-like domain